MSLTLYFHPLSSFCMKALVGLYELDVPFAKRIVDLANDADRAAFLKVWPLGKFPVLRDEARGITCAYFSRLAERPSFARVVDEAKPYASMFPG